MFKRIIHEGWTEIVPVIAFFLIFAVFVVATIRALRMKPKERDRMARLPLDDSPKPEDDRPSSDSNPQDDPDHVREKR